MTIITLQLIWIVLACLDGYLQAHYYSLYPSEKKHKNLHGWYVFQRAVVLGFMVNELSFSITWGECGVFAFASCFTYSFFHNGFYYMTRHKLDKEVYSKGFWDDSDSSSALLNIGSIFRTAMMILGIIFIIGLLI